MTSNSSSGETSAHGRLPFANWVTFDQSVEKANARASHPEPDQRKAELSRFMAALKWTMDRESDAADIIQRLAFRTDASSELGERAREHAAELKRLSMRLDVYLRKAGVSGDATMTMVKAAAANNAIAALDQNTATIVLVRYLIQHAEATYEVLEGVGKGLDAKAIGILCRKVAKEKQKIAAWIEKHGHSALQH